MHGAVSPLLKTLLFTVVAPGTVAVLVPHWLLPPRANVAWHTLEVCGVAAIALGASMYLSTAWNFAWFGRGTPAPIDPPRNLVISGLHRSVRNPMYVAVLLVVLGQAALYRAREILFYAVFLSLAFHLFVVFYEEPTLRRKFGAAYDDYCHAVPRWVPKLKP